MKKAKRQFVLGTGYPWYEWKDGSYTRLLLATKANRQEGNKIVPLKIKWGAWKKVRIIIEAA